MQTLPKILVLFLAASLLLSACSTTTGFGKEEPGLVIYSGRSESLLGPVIEQFEQASGIEVDVRWGGTPELAATLLEEGDRSPADVFFAQDPGGLGAVVDQLAPLPQELLDQVEARFRDSQGRWIGVSGRVRTIVYNTETLSPQDLPADLWGLTDPAWKGRLGWAPTNASFQTMVTAMRVLWGEDETRRWLDDIQANRPVAYENNASIVAAVGAGEVQAGLVNHYYLYRFLAEEGPDFPAANYFLPGDGPGSLVMVAGAGILKGSDHPEIAQKFLAFLLSPVVQQYFSAQTSEYPVVEGVIAPSGLPSLKEMASPQVDLSDLADLQGTVALLRDTGVLP